MEKWVQNEEKPNTYYPVTDDMQVKVGLSYITEGTPPGILVGTVKLGPNGVYRITLKYSPDDEIWGLITKEPQNAY